MLAQIVLGLVPLILSITVHEFAHAFAADKLGDDLPARQERLTLNPLAHIDPIGTLLVPVLQFIGVPLFGWGRPVETNPVAYTRKVSMRGGLAIVSFAGPAANLIMAVICAIILRVEVLDWNSPFVILAHNMVRLNITLFVFNLLPVPPLDGSKIVAWIFGPRVDSTLDAIAGYGILALYVAVFIFGSAIGYLSRFAEILLLG